MRGYVKKPPLSWIDANTVGLVATDTVPIWLTIGEKTGRLSGTLRANIGASGLGGMAEGAVAVNTAYYVYAVLSGGSPQLIIDATPPTQGPSGYGTWTYLGAVATDSGSVSITAFQVVGGAYIADNEIEYEEHTGNTNQSAESFGSLPVTAKKAWGQLGVSAGGVAGAVVYAAGTSAGTSQDALSAHCEVNARDVYNAGWVPIFTPNIIYLRTSDAAQTVRFELSGWQEDPELYA